MQKHSDAIILIVGVIALTITFFALKGAVNDANAICDEIAETSEYKETTTVKFRIWEETTTVITSETDPVTTEPETTVEVTTAAPETTVTEAATTCAVTEPPETVAPETSTEPSNGFIGTFLIVGYCPACNGSGGYATASGVYPQVGVTAAMNIGDMKRLGIHLGDRIYIDGFGERIIQDTGCGKGKIDLWCSCCSEEPKVTKGVWVG